jgi:transcriptional regulator with XRE-family HTH domain
MQDYLRTKIVAIGDNIKRLRRDKNWTQGELAKLSGVKVGHISKLERNESDPKLSTIYKLINALGCSPNSIINDVGETNIEGRLAMQFERAQSLPEKDKETVLDLIDKYCIAISLQDLLKENGKSSLRIMTGKTEPIAK